MKKPFCILAIFFLFNMFECSYNSDLEISDNEKSTGITIDNQITTVLFWEENNDYAYVLCAFENGEFKNLKEYEYNGESWEYFNGWNEEPYKEQNEKEVETDIIKVKEDFVFINELGDQVTDKTTSITCSGRGIDDFTEVHAYFSQAMTQSDRRLGLSSNIQPFPRQPQYEIQSIIIDLDDNGEEDEITWEFHETMWVEDFYDYVIDIVLNGKLYSIANLTGTTVAPENFEIFVADINNDGSFEIIIYEKSERIYSAINIYGTKNGDLEKIFEYIINPRN